MDWLSSRFFWLIFCFKCIEFDAIFLKFLYLRMVAKLFTPVFRFELLLILRKIWNWEEIYLSYLGPIAKKVKFDI
jgi:hypothetical protein